MSVPALVVLATIAALQAQGDDPVTYVQRAWRERMRRNRAARQVTRLFTRALRLLRDRDFPFYRPEERRLRVSLRQLRRFNPLDEDGDYAPPGIFR